MTTIGYYKVVVKIEIEDTETGKTKKSQEVYLVEDCGSPQAAADRVEKEMDGCMGVWRIDSVKEIKLTSVLNAKKNAF